MPLNINNMRSQLRFGGARASLFQVSITNPINGIADLRLPFLCKASSLPASTLGTIEVPYMGRKIKQPGDRTYADWTVTIINDEDFLIRNAMEQWQNAINTPRGNSATRGSAPSNYKSRAQVFQLDRQGNTLREITIDGLYPTEVSAIDLNWETTDSIQEFTVTFAYDYHEVTGGNTGNAGGAE